MILPHKRKISEYLDKQDLIETYRIPIGAPKAFIKAPIDQNKTRGLENSQVTIKGH